MLKLNFECRVVAQDQDTGYYRRRVVTAGNIYSFTVELASALIMITTEAGQHQKAKEFDDMERQSELPF